MFGVPIARERAAEAVTDTGWCSANGCSHEAIRLAGTNTVEAKTSGAMIGNAAACAVSGSFTASPTPANTQERVSE